MNPIKISLLTLVAWILLSCIAVIFTHWDGLSLAFSIFFLAPVPCLIAFFISSLFYPSWVKNHKRAFAISWTLLIFWILALIALYFILT